MKFAFKFWSPNQSFTFARQSQSFWVEKFGSKPQCIYSTTSCQVSTTTGATLLGRPENLSNLLGQGSGEERGEVDKWKSGEFYLADWSWQLQAIEIWKAANFETKCYFSKRSPSDPELGSIQTLDSAPEFSTVNTITPASLAASGY